MGQKNAKPGVDPKAKQRSHAIDRSLNKLQAESSNVIKLLLLGAGESGKSTCFRQMVRLYSDGFSHDELAYYAPIIRTNTVRAMADLLAIADAATAEEERFDPADEAVAAAAAAVRAATASAAGHAALTPELAAHIGTLWAAPALQAAYDRRAAYQIPDSASYFIPRAAELARPEYEPTEEHMIRCRVRTTGIVERQFTMENSTFSIVDVGGQRNERRKWIHCFDSVTAVIFVAAASEYDQVLFEDGETNRLDEALRLFAETTALKCFEDTSFILFLNKSDLFDDKIHVSPLSHWDETFEGDDHSFEQTMRHIANRFFDANQGQKRPFLHVTCATDHTSVDTVFRAVKRIVVAEHLKESGLIS